MTGLAKTSSKVTSSLARPSLLYGTLTALDLVRLKLYRAQPAHNDVTRQVWYMIFISFGSCEACELQ